MGLHDTLKFSDKTGIEGGRNHVPAGAPPNSPCAIMVKSEAKENSFSQEGKKKGEQNFIFPKENLTRDITLTMLTL